MVVGVIVSTGTRDTIEANVEADYAAQGPNVVSLTNTLGVSITRDALDSETFVVITISDPAVV